MENLSHEVAALKRRKRRGGRRGMRAATGRSQVGVVLLFVAAVLLGAMLFLHARLRPVIESVATYQAKVYAAKTINAAMLAQLETADVDYDGLVQVTQNKDGMVTSIQSDMVKINRLKSYVSRSVAADLESRKEESVFVPLGTLLGNEWTSGRGPKIEIRILPTGYVQSEIYNQFTSAGINQTHHEVMLRVTVQMIAILPGYSVKTETSSNFCIGETVIVGTIPEAFTQIEGDEAPTISKLNDYSAKAGK